MPEDWDNQKWRNEMGENHSDSALNKAYQETGLTNRQIQSVEEALEACANFYAILELKEVWRAVGSQLPVTKKEFDKLLNIFENDPYTLFEISNEKNFFDDGEDVPLLIDTSYFLSIDKGYKPKPKSKFDTNDIFDFDYDRFYSLYAQRDRKRLTVPSDLLAYADPDYYTETAYTDALLEFLQKNLPKDIDPEDALIEAIRRLREAELFRAHMVNFLWDLVAPENQTEDKLTEYLDLYMDLQNHTPSPYNRGAAPADTRLVGESTFSKPSPVGFPHPADRFAADGPEGLPDFGRIADLARMNPGSLPGAGNGGTVRNGKKIGPNDPCPCGSGKKYKKCCGSK